MQRNKLVIDSDRVTQDFDGTHYLNARNCLLPVYNTAWVIIFQCILLSLRYCSGLLGRYSKRLQLGTPLINGLMSDILFCMIHISFRLFRFCRGLISETRLLSRPIKLKAVMILMKKYLRPGYKII